MRDLALAALFGVFVGAPFWLWLGAIVAVGRTALATVRARIAAVARVIALDYQAAVEAIRERRVRAAVVALGQPHTGKHTPRGGTQAITGAIVPAPTKELAA